MSLLVFTYVLFDSQIPSFLGIHEHVYPSLNAPNSDYVSDMGVLAFEAGEVKKTIKVSGDFWGGDSKQVFTCDVLQYDPDYEFPNLRKGDVSCEDK